MDPCGRPGRAAGPAGDGTYDLSNLQDWPLQLTLVDMLWGTALTAVAAIAAFLAARAWGRPNALARPRKSRSCD
ncbi:MAG: DUF2177 family protein [Polaromonas sp.]|nr:DUF2177 family protein [Polaromonas sp.]MDI1268364.1 DUF2177 family protein [Polaromonas sp.]